MTYELTLIKFYFGTYPVLTVPKIYLLIILTHSFEIEATQILILGQPMLVMTKRLRHHLAANYVLKPFYINRHDTLSIRLDQLTIAGK